MSEASSLLSSSELALSAGLFSQNALVIDSDGSLEKNFRFWVAALDQTFLKLLLMIIPYLNSASFVLVLECI